MTYQRRTTALEQLRESQTLPRINQQTRVALHPIDCKRTCCAVPAAPRGWQFVESGLPEASNSQPVDVADYLRHCNAPYALDAARSANVYRPD